MIHHVKHSKFFALADARYRPRLTVVLSPQLKLGCIDALLCKDSAEAPPGGLEGGREHRLGRCLSTPGQACDHASESLQEYDSLIWHG